MGELCDAILASKKEVFHSFLVHFKNRSYGKVQVKLARILFSLLCLAYVVVVGVKHLPFAHFQFSILQKFKLNFNCFCFVN